MSQRRDQLADPSTSRLERAWGRLTGLTLGYGYQPWRALLFLLAVVGIAVTLTVTVGPHGGLGRIIHRPVTTATGSDMPAYANGHKHVGNKNGPLREKFADPDAGWGHRSSISTRKGGAFYGYKLHAVVDTATELPLAWTVRAANEPEQGEVAGLLDTLAGRGFTARVAVLNKGYDGEPMYETCESRSIRPVIALKETLAVKAGEHKPPSCEHGEWTFAGADAKRGATKWRCPAGECPPKSMWIKASRLHPLIPHGTERWKALYRQRTAVERGFGRLKTDWGLLPLRMRRLPRVTLHANLTILAQLASALLITRDT